MQENLFMTYRPSEDEEYMCANHLQYFKTKLLAWRRTLVAKSELFLEELKENGPKGADLLDRSAQHADFFVDYSTRARHCQTILEIDQALDRIEAGEYGWCEITGEEIGIKRLEARPAATRCIEAQEQFERLAHMRPKMASA